MIEDGATGRTWISLGGSGKSWSVPDCFFLTDHWSMRLVVGYPPKGSIDGSGIVQATGPLGTLLRIDLSEPQFNPIGSARQWVPVLMLAYHFGAADAAWRPYLGAGLSYAFFSEVVAPEESSTS